MTLLLDDTASKRLELLKEVAPRVRRTGFLWNRDHPDNELKEVQRVAPALQMDLQLVEVRESGDFKNAFRAMSHAQTDALYVVSSRHTVLNMASMVDFARTKRSHWLVDGGHRCVQADFSLLDPIKPGNPACIQDIRTRHGSRQTSLR